MADTPLSRIENFLSNDDLQTYLLPQNNENMFERLYVSLGKEDDEKERLVQMHFVNDVTESLGVATDPDDVYLLQFFLVLPYSIKEKALTDVARLMMHLNRMLPVGAFGLSESDRLAFYQYNLACNDRNVDLEVVREVLSIMTFFTVDYGRHIKSVGLGEKSFKDVITSLEAGGIKLPPIEFK